MKPNRMAGRSVGNLPPGSGLPGLRCRKGDGMTRPAEICFPALPRRCGTGRRDEAGEGENPGDSDEGHPKADPAGPGAADRATRNWQGGGGAMGMRRDAVGWEPRKACLPFVRGVPPFASGGRPSFRQAPVPAPARRKGAFFILSARKRLMALRLSNPAKKRRGLSSWRRPSGKMEVDEGSSAGEGD